MPKATLSRWTMTYFAVALVFLIGAEAMMAAGIGYPAADIADPVTLIVVHLVAIGWLSLTMAGALLQFLPVLLVRPLAAPRLALPALVLVGGGLVALCRVTTRAFVVPLGSTPQAIGALRLGVELCAIYWHFMLAVWLVLFAVMMRWTDELIAICRGLLT